MELFETANTRGEDGSKNIANDAMLTYANDGGFVTNINFQDYLATARNSQPKHRLVRPSAE